MWIFPPPPARSCGAATPPQAGDGTKAATASGLRERYTRKCCSASGHEHDSSSRCDWPYMAWGRASIFLIYQPADELAVLEEERTRATRTSSTAREPFTGAA